MVWRRLLSQMLGDVDAEWTPTIVVALDDKSEPTLETAGFKTHEMMVEAHIPGLAQFFKA
jgi:hypothetical protein